MSDDISYQDASAVYQRFGISTWDNELNMTVARVLLQAEAERVDHAAEVKRLTHGHYAFLLRHYALNYVCVHDQTLHDQGFSEAYQRIQCEGGAAYEDVVQQLAAEVAALEEIQSEALYVEQAGARLQFVVWVADKATKALSTTPTPQPDDRTARLKQAAQAAYDLISRESCDDIGFTTRSSAVWQQLQDALSDSKEVQ